MFDVTQKLTRDASDALLDLVTVTLGRGSSHLRFPRDIERLYQAEIRNHYRRRTLYTAGFSVLVIYGLVIAGLVGSPSADFARQALAGTSGLLAVGAAMTWLFWQPQAGHRQQIMAGAVIIFTLSVNLMLDGVQTENARIATYAFTLIVITANVVLSLDFRSAVATSAACCLVTAGFTATNHQTNWLGEVLPVLLMTATALLTLAANFRIETTSRYVYLLLLREKLQGRSIRAQNETLSQISRSDPLTGIPNRRAFDEMLERIWAEAFASRIPVALLMIDIDHFKSYNDTYGHPAGDACLTSIAAAIDEVTRGQGDFAARLGGEEFAVILQRADLRTARAIARRIHEKVASLRIPHGGSQTSAYVSVSIGMADASPEDGERPQVLLLAADKALYAAKSAGRNQTGSLDGKAA